MRIIKVVGLYKITDNKTYPYVFSVYMVNEYDERVYREYRHDKTDTKEIHVDELPKYIQEYLYRDDVYSTERLKAGDDDHFMCTFCKHG